jgi:hypothetical protein
MREANPVKYYLANYFFLGLALLQWAAAFIILSQDRASKKNLIAGFVLITLGLICLAVFAMVSEKIKRVAVGKNKIVVVGPFKKKKYTWNEVRSLKLVPWLNLYCLRIKGRKRGIYFFPAGRTLTTYGMLTADATPTGELIEKRKKQ